MRPSRRLVPVSRFLLAAFAASAAALVFGAGVSGASGRGAGARPAPAAANNAAAEAPSADPSPLYGLVAGLGANAVPTLPNPARQIIGPLLPQLPAHPASGLWAQIFSQLIGAPSGTPGATASPSEAPAAPAAPSPAAATNSPSFDDPVVSVGTLPTGVAASATRAYVANAQSNTVSVIDLSSNTVTATIPVGAFPAVVALAPDGTQVYVTNFNAGTLSIISTATNTVTATVTVGSRPNGVIRIGNSIYVANLTGHSISVVSATTNTVTGTIALADNPNPAAPSGLATNAAGTRLYVTDAKNGKLLVIDPAGPTVLSNSTSVGVFPAYVSVAGTTAYVANPGSNTVSVVNLGASPPTSTATVNVGTADYGVIAQPSLNQVLVTNSGSANLTVINATTNVAVGTFPMGTTPDAIAVTPDGATGIVTNEGDNTVNIFHINQRPVNTVPGSQNVNANGTGSANKITFTGGTLISVADSDVGTNPVSVALTVNQGTLKLSQTTGLNFTAGADNTGAMTFTGTLANVNAALAGMQYTPTTGYHGGDTLTVNTSDSGSTGVGQAQTDSDTVSINVQNAAPVAGAVSFTGAVGNTIFGVGQTPNQPETHTAGNVLSNSTDANNDTLSVVAGNITTANGGTVVMSSNGTFTYITAAGGATGNDTFTFVVTDGITNTNGTATVTVANRVWYVNNALGSNGNGRSTSPFNTLANVNGSPDADVAGDYIFLYQGSGNYTGGLVLEDSEKLIGQPEGLVISTVTLVSAGGTNPTITNTAGIGITLANDNVIRRVNVTGTSQQGISGGAITNADIGPNLSITNSTGVGFSLNGAASGTVTMAGSITHSSGSARSFFVQNRTGGTVTMTGAINDTGGGIFLNSDTGTTINFTGGITSSTGSAGAAFTAQGGGTVNVTGTNTLTTTAAIGLTVSGSTIGTSGLTFQSINVGSGATPVNGIVLNGTGSGNLSVTGTGSAGSGGTIQNTTGDAISLTNVGGTVTLTDMATTNDTGTDVLVDTGTGSVSFNGPITNQSGKGRSVVVQNKTGGTVALSGAINDNGTGILLNNNTNTTTNITGGLVMSTAANAAFTATGGGTVTVTGSNNTIATTTGTALNVTSTTIGASGLTFKSIAAGTAASGPASGIILSNTGTSGGLTVSGTGSAGSGGTIQKTSNSGIDANGTKNLNLSWMAFANNGDALNEGGVRLQEVTGTGQFTSSTITGAFEDGFFLKNTTGTLTSFTIQGPNCSITNNNTSMGNDAVNIQSAVSAIMTTTVNNCTFNGNRTDTIHADAADSSTLTTSITNNTITAGTAGNNTGNIGIEATGAISSTLNYTIDNNKVGTPDGTTNSHLLNTGINVFTAGTTSTAVGTVTNNTVFGPGSGNSGWGIRVATGSGSTGRSRVQGNAVHNLGNDDGILIDVGLNSGSTAKGDMGIISNSVDNAPSPNGLDGIRIIVHNSGVGCIKVANNVGQTGGGLDDLVLRVSNSGTFKLDGGTPNGAMTAAQAQTYAAAQNPSATTSASAGASPANYQGVAAGTCNIPS